MSAKGQFDPGQLAVITAVLDDYCLAEDIGAAAERDKLARKAMDLYSEGIRSPGELRRALAQFRDPD